jgi:hypothetical protein
MEIIVTSLSAQTGKPEYKINRDSSPVLLPGCGDTRFAAPDMTAARPFMPS